MISIPPATTSQNFLNYMIRDAGLDEEEVAAWKVALTMEQVRSQGLPESFERVKPLDPKGPAYIAKYGTDYVWELDALTPAQLANLLEEAILDVIDVEAYERSWPRKSATSKRSRS